MDNPSRNRQHNVNSGTKEDLTRAIMEMMGTVRRLEEQERRDIEGLHRTAKKVIILLPATLAVTLLVFFVALPHNQAQSIPRAGGYVIENLQGDTINTWVSWNILPGDPLNVNIVNSAGLPQGKIDVVRGAILSNQTAVLGDSLFRTDMNGTSKFYLGWQGALDSIKRRQTEFYIPESFKVTQIPDKVGDITIFLVTGESPDGLSGFTSNTADGNQILSSKVTIYQADRLSDGQLAAIARHEFGHALGLAHSAAPYDLMHQTIETSYPYISQCDIEAVSALYAGDDSSQIVCDR